MNLFNESIKQKSSDFYTNYAKDKIDQLNKYVTEQNRSVGLHDDTEERSDEVKESQADSASALAASSDDVGADLESTIELQAECKEEGDTAANMESTAEPSILKESGTKAKPTRQ